MKEKIQEVLKWLLTLALSQVLESITILLFGLFIGYISTTVLVSVHVFLENYWIPIFIFISALFFALGSWLLSRSENQSQKQTVEVDLKSLERHIFYKWTSTNSIEYKKKFKFKALRNNVDRYSDRWIWTGKGTVKTTNLISTQRIVNLEKMAIWDVFDICFNRCLKKGEVIESEILWNIDNIEEKPIPFCSATIIEPTDVLRIMVSFPHDFKITKIWLELKNNMASKQPIFSKEAHLNNNNEYEWTIKKPLLLHYYQIRWLWSD